MASLIDLPDAVLMKILSFLPNRMSYAPVCKKFYELISAIDQYKYKMKLGRIGQDAIDRMSIRNTRRVFDTLDVYLDFKSDDDVTLLKDVYQRHGPAVKNLEWCNWSTFKLNEDFVVEMLDLMPNIEELKFAAWSTEFVKSESSAKKALNLKKLKKLEISECSPFIFEFLVNHLPENIVEELVVERMTVPAEVMKAFIAKQSSITSLNISGIDYSENLFESLKLKNLRILMDENETPTAQREFLKSLIQSQPGLVTLTTLTGRDYSYYYVNDEVFQEITKCQFLETLKINIDGVTGNGIKSIQKLKNLRTFEVKIERENTLETFLELSLLKLPLENLVLKLSTFEVPQQTYRQFGENFNLKSLRITLGTWHQISFFIESFPTLESLSIRFGEANNRVEMSRVFNEDDLKIHANLKNLEFQFWGEELITSEKFLKLSSCFPNLEKLKINSKFPFSADFFNTISSKLTNIKSLDISGVSVEDNETFPPEVIESLKKLGKKLTYCNLILRYEKFLMGGFTMLGEAPEEVEQPQQPEREFTFAPLREALKDYFKIKEDCMSNIRLMRNLHLTIGKVGKA